MPEKNPSGPNRPNDFYKYTGMAIKMGVVILMGVLGGQKLDEMSENESPWYTIALSLFSVAIAIYIVIAEPNDSIMNAYFKQFVLILAACIIGALMAAQFIAKVPVPMAFWICFGFITIASFAIHRILTDASEKRPQIFVAYFMGALTAKLLLSGILLVVAGLLDRDGLKFTAIGFLITYVLLTILEIRHLLPLMKNQKEE